MLKLRYTFFLFCFLSIGFLIGGCVSLDMQMQDPTGGSATEAPERPRKFHFISRAVTMTDWVEGSDSPARWLRVGFMPETVLHVGPSIVIAGHVRTFGTTPEVPARSLMLTSKDGGKTWHEEDIVVPLASITDLRTASGVMSGLVFSAHGDGRLEGLALNRALNRGKWTYLSTPKDFDAQKKIGYGSYYHLGHDVSRDAMIYLEGADKVAEFKFDLKSPAVTFERFLSPAQVESRRKMMPDPRGAEQEWLRLLPSNPPFWIDRRSGQLSDLPQ